MLNDFSGRCSAPWHLQVLHTAANLASPAILVQYLAVQFAITVGIELECRGPDGSETPAECRRR